MSLKNPLKRSLTEFVVIVVGVLSAFAVDDWRQGLEEGQIQLDALVQLQSDLEQDSIDLARARDDVGNRAVAGLRVLARLGTPESTLAAIRRDLDHLVRLAPDPLPRDGLDEMPHELMAFFQTQVFDSNRAAFSNLLGSGQLRLVRDDALRSEIVEYYSLADRGADGRASTRVAQSQFVEFLHRRGVTALDLLSGSVSFSVLRDLPGLAPEVMAVLWAAQLQETRLTLIEARRLTLAAMLADRLM